jgi:hypothetical protein
MKLQPKRILEKLLRKLLLALLKKVRRWRTTRVKVKLMKILKIRLLRKLERSLSQKKKGRRRSPLQLLRFRKSRWRWKPNLLALSQRLPLKGR